jgi:HD superfamily phosphohydrolase
MSKHVHEIRDPIHVFIRLDSEERKALNSRPVQRLRYIHQLALTHLVYPAATHRRFEHSLGVVELAGRVYDIVSNPANIQHESVRRVVPPPGTHEHTYWRRVLRMAALCHDIGHLPFSHAAETELLPEGWDHERISMELIRSEEMDSLWKKLKIQADDVAKLAVGPMKFRDAPFTEWEAILSEIIVGNAFGVDRMDYLLRDSYHAGVAYGRFDHFRLIDTIRILPSPIPTETIVDPGRETQNVADANASSAGASEEGAPTLGIDEGGLQSAEALLFARYFMYSQLYFHPIRRMYDIHLREFLKHWLPDSKFSTQLEDHLNLTDNEVMTAVLAAARDRQEPGHDPADRIVHRGHYKRLYQRNPNDVALNPEAAKAIYKAACAEYDGTNVQYDCYKEEGRSLDFPVLTHDGRIVSCLALSDTLNRVPIVAVDYVFINPDLLAEAERWLKQNLTAIIAPKAEDES